MVPVLLALSLSYLTVSFFASFLIIVLSRDAGLSLSMLSFFAIRQSSRKVPLLLAQVEPLSLTPVRHAHLNSSGPSQLGKYSA